MAGKVIIVTGANTGLGFLSVQILCRQGHKVILACRNEGKGKAAVERIITETPNAKATYMHLDVACFLSIREFVDEFHKTGKQLDVLINNAGSFAPDKRTKHYTVDNFELTMRTNHLDTQNIRTFLLTNLLLGDLKSSASQNGEARVVVLTSVIHDPQKAKTFGVKSPFDPEDIFLDKKGSFDSMSAYRNSKLCNMLFTYQLARMLQGSGVTVNCIHPGFIPKTDFMRGNSLAVRILMQTLLTPFFKLFNFTRTPEQGALAIVDLANNDKWKGVTGKYLVNQKITSSLDESMNEELQKKIWDLSARYCQLPGYEPLVPPTATKQ